MTLQEYLVKLGWSIDEPSMKRFFGALAATSAKTAELGSVVVETAGAIELMVDRVARKYETLYYVSQRTGQSVKYIQSTQFAFKQIGLSADDATASIESIGAALRTQPWLRAIFGNASTPQDVASRLGKSGLPYFLQARFAEMIGMDEKTLFHLQKFGDVEQKAQQDFARRQREAGIDPDALAKKSVVLTRAINRLESGLEILGDRIALDFIDPVTHGVEQLDHFVEWLIKADVATKGWGGTLATFVGTGGGIILLEKALKRIAGLLFGGGAAAAASGEAAAGGAAAAAGGGAILPLTAAAGAAYAGYLGSQKYGAFGVPYQYNKKYLKGGGFSDQQLNKVQQATAFFEKAGFSHESAVGIASGLFAESQLDPKALLRDQSGTAKGIGQWRGSRQALFRSIYGKDIGDATLEEQLSFVLHELTQEGGDPGALAAGKRLYRGGLDTKGAQGTFIHMFERPGPAGEMGDMARAGAVSDALSRLADKGGGGTTNNINLKSTTTVNVPPGADTSSAAKAFGQAQDLANENFIRNSTAKMR